MNMLTNTDELPVNPQVNQETTVFLIEDDSNLRIEIDEHLRLNGFKVRSFENASNFYDHFYFKEKDLFVIDLNLPGESGLNLSKRIRESVPLAGIIIITAQPGLSEKLEGYSVGGADFYLNKPIFPDELVLILKNLHKRLGGNKNSVQNTWNLSLRDRVLIDPFLTHKIRLTARECSLLVEFYKATDYTLESEYLMEIFTSKDGDELMSKHALEELVARLRRKIKVAQQEGNDQSIKSVWGVGYQLTIKIDLSQ